jgi:hypothetical protein
MARTTIFYTKESGRGRSYEDCWIDGGYLLAPAATSAEAAVVTRYSAKRGRAVTSTGNLRGCLPLVGGQSFVDLDQAWVHLSLIICYKYWFARCDFRLSSGLGDKKRGSP